MGVVFMLHVDWERVLLQSWFATLVMLLAVCAMIFTWVKEI